MNQLLSSYSKEKLLSLVEKFGDYIIENAPELKVQFKDYVLGNKRFSDDTIPVIALMTLYPENFKEEFRKCLKTFYEFGELKENDSAEYTRYTGSEIIGGKCNV